MIILTNHGTTTNNIVSQNSSHKNHRRDWDGCSSTMESFGYQWKTFGVMHDKNMEEFWAYLDLESPDELAGKVVLDAGCGSGRFSRAAAELGARQVIGLDISSAVEEARRVVNGCQNAAIVKGDILKLPFRGESFDMIFSIGVLHHLPDPRRGFHELTRYLKPGGKLYIWVYSREGNGAVIRVLEPIRKHLTSKWPYALTKGLSFVLAAVLWGIIGGFYLPLRYVGRQEWLPMARYFHYLWDLGFRATWATIFDKLTPQIVHYHNRTELEGWFHDVALFNVAISGRNDNSWRACGVKCFPD